MREIKACPVLHKITLYIRISSPPGPKCSELDEHEQKMADKRQTKSQTGESIHIHNGSMEDRTLCVCGCRFFTRLITITCGMCSAEYMNMTCNNALQFPLGKCQQLHLITDYRYEKTVDDLTATFNVV